MKKYNLSYSKYELDLKTGAIKNVSTFNKRGAIYEEYSDILQFIDTSKLATEDDLHDFTDLLGYPIYDFQNWNNIYSHSCQNDILYIIHKQCDYNKHYSDLDTENKAFHIYIFNLFKTYSMSINILYTHFKDLCNWDIPDDIQNYFENSDEK